MRALILLVCTTLLTCGNLQCRAEDSAVTAARRTQGMVFLTKIRIADPNYDTVLMACLKENELNLLLSSRFPADQIPTLVKGLAGQLHQALPGQNLRVIAFRPIVPLREAGVAEIEGVSGTIHYTDLMSSSGQ